MKTKNIDSVKIVSHIIFILFCICCIIPLLMLISSSVTPNDVIKESGLSLIPKKVTLDAYRMIFAKPQNLLRAYGVTIFITVVGTVINLLVCTMTAYSLMRKSFEYRRVVSFVIYFTMLFSGGLVPLYILITKYLHMQNNILVMIIPQMASPMLIFLMRTYLSDIPSALFEAATIDGATEYGIFFKIVLPLSVPALSAGGFITVLAYWNEWYYCMLFITDEKLYPLQMLLQNILNYVSLLKSGNSMLTASIANNVPSNAVTSATCFLVIAPMLTAFVFFQKYFVQGITAGAVKG